MRRVRRISSPAVVWSKGDSVEHHVIMWKILLSQILADGKMLGHQLQINNVFTFSTSLTYYHHELPPPLSTPPSLTSSSHFNGQWQVNHKGSRRSASRALVCFSIFIFKWLLTIFIGKLQHVNNDNTSATGQWRQRSATGQQQWQWGQPQGLEMHCISSPGMFFYIHFLMTTNDFYR